MALYAGACYQFNLIQFNSIHLNSFQFDLHTLEQIGGKVQICIFLTFPASCYLMPLCYNIKFCILVMASRDASRGFIARFVTRAGENWLKQKACGVSGGADAVKRKAGIM
nr:MAG TPA: hypothetical protein [Caudoviricetes sp.]